MKKATSKIVSVVKDPFGINRKLNSMESRLSEMMHDIAEDKVRDDTENMIQNAMEDMVYNYDLVTADNIHDSLNSGYTSVVYEDDLGSHISSYLEDNPENIESIIDSYCDDTYVTPDEVRELTQKLVQELLAEVDPNGVQFNEKVNQMQKTISVMVSAMSTVLSFVQQEQQ